MPKGFYIRSRTCKNGHNTAIVGKYSTNCKKCKNEYGNLYYKLNKEKISKQRKAYRLAHPEIYRDARLKKYKITSDIVNRYKDNPCTDCGNKYPPYAMDFDHLFDKSFNIGNARGFNIEKLEREIEKCELVCAVCHRIRTYDRMHQAAGHQTSTESSL